MTHFRSFVLAASLAAVALPAVAQTAPDTAPAAPGTTAPAETAVPDTGVKKAAPVTRTHHRVRHVRTHSTTQAVPPTNTK